MSRRRIVLLICLGIAGLAAVVAACCIFLRDPGWAYYAPTTFCAGPFDHAKTVTRNLCYKNGYCHDVKVTTVYFADERDCCFEGDIGWDLPPTGTPVILERSYWNGRFRLRIL